MSYPEELRQQVKDNIAGAIVTVALIFVVLTIGLFFLYLARSI